MQKWETVLAFVFRGAYAVMSVTMLTKLWNSFLSSSSGASEMEYHAAVFIILLAFIIPVSLAQAFIYMEKALINDIRSKGIKYPKLYVPLIVYVLYLATIWINFFIPHFEWIFLVLSVGITEWYFYQKRKAIRKYLEVIQG